MRGDGEQRQNPVDVRSSQPVLMMYESDDDSVELTELFEGIWRGKWFVVAATLVFACSAVAYALLATPIYRAQVTLAKNTSEGRSAISGGLGGLASLAGIEIGSSADGEEALATLRSQIFAEEFILDRDLLPVLFSDQWDESRGRWEVDEPSDVPDMADGIEKFLEDVVSVDEDSATGLVVLYVEWEDPRLAADWAGQLVARINDRLRASDLADSQRRLEYLNQELANASLVELRQAISRLVENEIQKMTVAKAEVEYAFKVIDPPRVPKKQVWPKRALIVVLATFVGLVVGLLLALGRFALTRARGTNGRN